MWLVEPPDNGPDDVDRPTLLRSILPATKWSPSGNLANLVTPTIFHLCSPQHLLKASSSGNLKSAFDCSEESKNFVRFEYQDFKSDVTALFVAVHTGNDGDESGRRRWRDGGDESGRRRCPFSRIVYVYDSSSSPEIRSSPVNHKLLARQKSPANSRRTGYELDWKIKNADDESLIRRTKSGTRVPETV
ncbi:hypothetical protein SSX86_030245 [Deinandra increscens subsp. villosa]|uniref:Uncharacterized protein n=1 Tax=Deinandra increscens subsp. villosa TaxID=3103831 RepID=A0AAP0GIF3_9ASTR